MEIVRETKRYDLFCKIKNYSLGEVYPFHWHENYEICEVINKPCAFRIDGEVTEALPGDLVAISEQTVHEFLIREDDTKIRVIQFNPAILFSLTDKILPLQTHISHEAIEKIPVLKTRLESLLTLMEAEENADDSDKNKYYKAVTAALYFLLQQYFPGMQNGHAGKGEREAFYRIIAYINAHYTENMTVNAISARFYYSRGKLSAIFRKYAGMGVNEYVNRLRIRHANKLLLQGHSSISAALSSGFGSVRTFNNCYKKIMGITPGEYVTSR